MPAQNLQNYRRGMLLILVVIIINFFSGIGYFVGSLNLLELIFYLFASLLMYLSFVITWQGNGRGFYIGLILYGFGLYFIALDIFADGAYLKLVGISIVAFILIQAACAYAKFPKDIDLGETLYGKEKTFNIGDVFTVNLALVENDLCRITPGALRQDKAKMACIAEKTRWRLIVLQIARVMAVIAFVGIIVEFVRDYQYYDYVFLYAAFNLPLLLLALVFSFFWPEIGFSVLAAKMIYVNLNYLIGNIFNPPGPETIVFWLFDLVFFVFLFVAVYAGGTVPWPVALGKTYRKIWADQNTRRIKKRKGQPVLGKRERLTESIVFKEGFEGK